MNKLLITIISVALFVLPMFFSCSSTQHQVASIQSSDSIAMRHAITEMIMERPEATLQDIYKSCFQDYFGPAHIIANRHSARDYIVKELLHATITDSSYYEPCGWRGNYVRVNLNVLTDSIISADAFAELFFRSTPNSTPVVDEQWINEWNKIASLVKEIVQEQAPRLPRKMALIEHFERDSSLIDNLLKEGKYVMHHSEEYSNAYNPHYRIIRRDIFEQEILPLIESR